MNAITLIAPEHLGHTRGSTSRQRTADRLHVTNIVALAMRSTFGGLEYCKWVKYVPKRSF